MTAVPSSPSRRRKVGNRRGRKSRASDWLNKWKEQNGNVVRGE